MLEPSLKKVNEDRDMMHRIITEQEQQKRKIEDIEFAVIKTDNKCNVFDDIFRSIAKLVRKWNTLIWI